MIRKPYRVLQAALLTNALGVAAMAAFAALSDKPPQGVSLASTGWYIDPYRTDDPNEVIEEAMEEKERRRGTSSDVLDDGEGPWARGGRGDDPWSDDRDVPSNRRTSPRGRRSTGVDIDPTGTTQSASVQFGSMGQRSPYLDQLRKNPEKLSFTRVDQDLTILADGLSTTCGPGGKIPITDALGNAELLCGWDGRAWVVETTRGKDFTRKDRYELSKDGKVLRYITTATGKGLPKVRISRTYTLAGS